MTEISTGYKVVEIHVRAAPGGETIYRSAIIPRVLYYEIGKITTPDFGKIFLFDSFDSAVEFGIGAFGVHSKNWAVLFCEYQRSEKQLDIVPSCLCSLREMRLYWERGFWPQHDTYALSAVPVGTVFADWVRPVHQITKDDVDRILAGENPV